MTGMPTPGPVVDWMFVNILFRADQVYPARLMAFITDLIALSSRLSLLRLKTASPVRTNSRF